MTPEEIADLIDRYKGHFALTSVGLALATGPNVEQHLDDMQISLDDPIELRRRDRPDYVLPIRQTISTASHDHERKFAVIDAWLELAIMRVADELDQNNYFDKAPVLVFLRHVRNVT
ncbi:hypothetical protein [Nocardia salmonicida]|uniref:hypothetical protein n=1 Tax=Nocardia salmonicida TaxID=53431 RepID=UPI002E286624|nr:hypothetical protein [Nocardia salmonicida]